MCNGFYTAYFTTPNKDRLTILDILSRETLRYSLDHSTYQMLVEYNIRKAHLERVKNIGVRENLTRSEIEAVLDEIFTGSHRQKRSRRFVLEASAITYYKKLDYSVRHLICDEAPQFDKVTDYRAICWVHVGRHFKKLNPLVQSHKNKLGFFIKQFWGFYKQLVDYKVHPDDVFAQNISDTFDTLFGTKTGYEALDKLIDQTRRKKELLLLVLKFPHLPLNNNPAELAARFQARKRDVNYQTRNDKGTRAKDTFASIVQTARKLKVNVYDYIYDRISKHFKMPSLACLIVQRSLTADTS